MSHTFLLRPGRWSAQGRFFDDRYRLQAVRGELEVSHEALAWTVRGRLELVESERSLELDCPVAPSKGGTAANWSFLHPRFGRLAGSWELAGRRMFSSFGSEDGLFSGLATFTRKADRGYLAEGELRRTGAIVCSWELGLTPRGK